MNNYPSIKTGDTTYDKIWEYFLSETSVTLTPNQDEIRKRWLSAWTLRLEFHSTEQAVNVHMAKFEVSRAQTFRDLRNAEKLFGSLSKTNKDGKRAIWAEYCHKFYLMCVKQKDLQSMGKALDLLGKAYEVDKIDDATHNPEKLENKPIKLSISKASAELIATSLKTGIIDYNKLTIEDAEIVKDE